MHAEPHEPGAAVDAVGIADRQSIGGIDGTRAPFYVRTEQEMLVESIARVQATEHERAD